MSNPESNDKHFILEMDLSDFYLKKTKKKLIVFQRKGENPSFFEFVSRKKIELLSFLSMIILFMTLVSCRSYELSEIVNPENPDESKHEDLSIRGHICQNKSFLVSFAAMMLFTVFVSKFLKKYIDKQKYKKKIKNI